jgi:trimethylamine--corrinoid protein Co-methyltransferase
VSNIWGVGQLESEMTFSPAQAVMDDEMISCVRRFLRGIAVDEESLAVDLIRSVGIGGSFLAETHTAEHFRSEFFEPGLLCRVNRAAWEARGGRRLHEAAEERARELMKEDVDCGLTDSQTAELERLSKRFEARIRGG